MRDLIPNPFESEATAQRFAHRDLSDRSSEELWAETVILEAELARRLTQRRRPRILIAWPAIITDVDWLLGRVQALHVEQQRKHHAA